MYEKFSFSTSSAACVFISIFNTVFPYWFCLDDLSTDESGMLKSPTTTVLLSISPFMAVSVCLILRCSYVGCIYYLQLLHLLGLILWSLYTVLCFLQVCFAWYAYEYCYSSFLLISICTEYLFPFSHFQSVCVLDPKWFSYRQHTYGPCFCTHSPVYVFWLKHLIHLHLRWSLIGMFLLPFYCFGLFS